MKLRCGRFELRLERPLVMGVLNVTPDSFSDGGRYFGHENALGRARAMVEEGADLIDIGGESTRPGAAPVPEDEELRRVLPVIEALHGAGVPLSVDTRRPRVMREAIAAGISMVNDVEALRAPGALETVARGDCAVCLMHMQGRPATMQAAPHYADVVGEVKAFLRGRMAACLGAGIARERIVVDPGFGFGKTLIHNLELLRHLGELVKLGVPVLAGLSRKSMLGAILGRPEADRTAASLAAALLAAERGARILRVHDIRETRDALAVWQALATP